MPYRKPMKKKSKGMLAAVCLAYGLCQLSVPMTAWGATKPISTVTKMSHTEIQENVEDYPMTVVTPAFMTSELKRGFMAGFLLYLPFLLIDVVVASTLMSMGMVMLPPTMVALPFKLLLFITVNGWELLFSTLIQSFR